MENNDMNVVVNNSDLFGKKEDIKNMSLEERRKYRKRRNKTYLSNAKPLMISLKDK